MKSYVLFLSISLLLISSCTLKNEIETPSSNEEKALLAKHQWHGMEATHFTNDHINGKNNINNLTYSINKNNQFVLKKNGMIVKNGTWKLLNISNQPVLRLFSLYEDDNIITEDFEISVLTEKYLQMTSYEYDRDGNILRTDYFFSQ